MRKIDRLTCPVCRARFFEEDDVVWCPICGAPHHRACWQQVGHCAYEQTHGTPDQWQMPSEDPTAADGASPGGTDRVGHACPRCGRLSSSDTLFCPYCGHAFGGSVPPDAPEGPAPVSPFAVRPGDPLGGVDPTAAIDGIPVADMAAMVAVNTPWYLPRFDRFSRSGNRRRVAWNWAAFLFPSGWLLWRKCVAAGFAAMVLSLASSLLTLPFLNALYAALPAGATSAELAAAWSVGGVSVPLPALLMVLAGGVLAVAGRVLFGLFGTYIYKSRCLRKLEQIRRLEEDDGDPQNALLRARGVNLFGPLLAYALQEMLLMLLTSLI